MLRRRELKPPLRSVRPKPDTHSPSKIKDTNTLPKIGAAVPRPGTLRFPVGAETRAFYRRFYPNTSTIEWNDWRWQMRARIRTLDELARIFRLSDDERSAVERHEGSLPVGITPYYASLMGLDDAREPLRRTHIMTGDEYIRLPGEDDDPLGEDHDTVAPGLVHRYPDRVLFLTTGTCSTYCRYCTRARVVGNPGGEYQFSTRQWEQALAYLEQHTEVRDVLLSGGDPLTLGDDKLDWLLGRLRAIKHIEFIRIGTKMPAVMPQRITKNLVTILKKHHPLWMSIHFTHPSELTPELTEATARLADAGIPLGSQTVLLKDINDACRCDGAADARTAEAPRAALLPLSVRSDPRLRPFPDHVSKGLEIIEGLRGHTTGYATPIFAVDAPGGGGKIQLAPDHVVGRDGDDLLLRNFEGNVYRYPDPGGMLGGTNKSR